MSESCEAIVGYFVFGPERCGKTATSEAIDATWGSIHPVCPEHTPTPTERESAEEQR